MKFRRGDFWLGYPSAVRVFSHNSRILLAAPQNALGITFFHLQVGRGGGKRTTLCRAWSFEGCLPFVELEQRDLTDLFPLFWVVTQGGPYG
ncbi:unnamed protein product [Tuber melanosporum]|uniref:(Perigord truffle) hypothetical protein n=1 Tax=Tuber melanosporum (strain Mel28) TaxID=656061 RepID=D5GGW0_TUBMM|nr:uncharacterized protein GSTUM_00002061001 [Tuber melanosporum]CAZ83753.1 unnamed protein product [Tuber melanosporum]